MVGSPAFAGLSRRYWPSDLGQGLIRYALRLQGGQRHTRHHVDVFGRCAGVPTESPVSAFPKGLHRCLRMDPTEWESENKTSELASGRTLSYRCLHISTAAALRVGTGGADYRNVQRCGARMLQCCLRCPLLVLFCARLLVLPRSSSCRLPPKSASYPPCFRASSANVRRQALIRPRKPAPPASPQANSARASLRPPDPLDTGLGLRARAQASMKAARAIPHRRSLANRIAAGSGSATRGASQIAGWLRSFSQPCGRRRRSIHQTTKSQQ